MQSLVKWSSNGLTPSKKLVGIKIKNMVTHTCLDQSLLVDQILTNYKRTYYLCQSTLEEPLTINTGESVDSTKYCSTLGLLMYLCSGTRPDLSYSVNSLARYSTNPSKEHW